MKRRIYITVPDVPVGYEQNLFGPGAFSIVVPVQRTNLVTNPSFETATTGYTAVGGSIAQSTTKQYHGAYSLAVTPSTGVTDGVYYGTVSLTSGTTYAASCKVWGIPGRTYKLSFATTGGADLSAYHFTATGRWQWVWVYWTETSTTTRRIYVTKDTSSNTNVFYIDGVQVEAIAAGETVSTYLDGEQQPLLPGQFPAPYYWTGTPHASTSVRLATTRAGGMVINLDKLRYHVTAWAGLGITAVSVISGTPAAADGAIYQTTIARARQFTVSGYVDATGIVALDQARSDLYRIIGPDSAQPRQPLVLHYQKYDHLTPISEMGRIVASYQGGLEGLENSAQRETAPISFTTYLPSIQTGESGGAMSASRTLANANGIAMRSPDGTWNVMGTGGAGMTQGVLALAVAPDGKVYAGGDFTGMGGVANTDGIAYWDGSAWNAMGTGISSGTNRVRAITVGADGSVYVAGDFSAMGGVANTSRIAKWDGSVWTALSTGANAAVYSLVAGPDGNIYAGGDFTSIGGVAIDRIAKWNGSAWSALHATGANGTVWALIVARDGYVYAGGDFSTVGGVTVNGVAKWDGANYTSLAGAFGGVGSVRTLASGLSGILYAGGSFTGAIDYAAAWNGTGWVQIGTLDNQVDVMLVEPNGILRAGGLFTVADGATLADGLARWNGSSWVSSDIDLPSTADVRSLAQSSDGTLYVGFDTTGTATATAVNTVQNDGTARAFPTFRLVTASGGVGGRTVYQLVNATTGKGLYFKNLTLAYSETVVITVQQGGVTAVSTLRGDISSAILPGSSADLSLVPGTNTLLIFAGDTNKIAVTAFWSRNYQALADLTN